MRGRDAKERTNKQSERQRCRSRSLTCTLMIKLIEAHGSRAHFYKGPVAPPPPPPPPPPPCAAAAACGCRSPRPPFLVFCFCSLMRLADCCLGCFLPLARGFCAIVLRGAGRDATRLVFTKSLSEVFGVQWGVDNCTGES